MTDEVTIDIDEASAPPESFFEAEARRRRVAQAYESAGESVAQREARQERERKEAEENTR
jgi:hypothetical protein